MDPKKLTREYISSHKLMQIATSEDDNPWVASVFYSQSGDGSLLWISLPETRHSQNIRSNPSAAITIVVEPDPEKGITAVQVKGQAYEVGDPAEIQKYIAMYAEKMGRESAFVEEFIAGGNPHKLYKFAPEEYQLWDRKNFDSSESPMAVEL